MLMRHSKDSMNVTSNFVPRIRPHQLPKVCVAVVGRTAAEMVEKAEAHVRDNPFVEFRLDYLPHPLLALKPVFLTEYPASQRWRTMGSPIMPSPMKPIDGSAVHIKAS